MNNDKITALSGRLQTVAEESPYKHQEKKATTSTSSVTPPALTNIRRRKPQPVPAVLLLQPLQTSEESKTNQYLQCYSSNPYKHQKKKDTTSTSSVTPPALTNIRRRKPQPPVPAVLLLQHLQTSGEENTTTCTSSVTLPALTNIRRRKPQLVPAVLSSGSYKKHLVLSLTARGVPSHRPGG
ncbi:hypothetical protein PoB_000822000 [Plakobranchus ocellatus]|uniref:Uncharacterized protein n=1 Tax=Plakobranchus ocellatus TaxID=259542 RepID=A0AAV3YGT4_9GAST|nr:hypothetical protein PoB_000822000 [Plakobranchus ocellatus]